ncbi:hypothetical protein ['Paenibacillus yunnanensis' Narsing Rao et al. 2020]|nr:hypothetical protein [Paenibacillus tengchongensis]
MEIDIFFVKMQAANVQPGNRLHFAVLELKIVVGVSYLAGVAQAAENL